MSPRTVRRLLRMTPGEIVCRSRQELSKQLDRLGWAGLGPGRASAMDPGLPGRWREAAPGRFFSGATTAETAAWLADRLPGSERRVVSSAERLLHGGFDLLGYHNLSFGDPVNWHLDPTTGQRAPLSHWSRLDPLDAEAVGDSKVTWELNRHQWLVRLGQAYYLTHDERYARAVAAAVSSWMDANPRGLGLNWSSSLEVALRLISWCWVLILFRDARSLSGVLQRHMLEGIGAHAAHVETYLSHYFSPNTHLTGEALGLVYAGVLLADLPDARHWRSLGASILVQESERQILPDGVYFEQATCYQRYTAEIYLHFLILAARNGIQVPGVVAERLQCLLDALLALQRPDRSLPAIGDADGGWLLPLDSRLADDARGIFSTAAALFRRPDYAWAAGGPAPETLWLLGPEGIRALDHLRPAPPDGAPSRLLSDGGYAILRSSWEAGADHVIFDVGPLGCPISGAHGHADLLSIQCSFRGRPFLVDPGTFRYTADGGWRTHYRTTESHSTVEVDGLSQATPRGPFGWDAGPRARATRWLSSRLVDFAEGEHHAYRFLSDPVIHRRRVMLQKAAGYCVVVDDLAGATEHRIDLRFQFAPMPVTLDPTLWIRAGTMDGPSLLIRAYASVPLKVAILEGEMEPRQGWVSRDYGRQEPAPVLVYSTLARLPVRIVTLLWPSEDPMAPPPAVSLRTDATENPIGLVIGDDHQAVDLEPAGLGPIDG